MNDNHLFIGLTVATLAGALTIAPPLASAVGHLIIGEAKVTVEDDAVTNKMSTAAAIAKDGTAGAFGYGYVAPEFENATVVVKTAHAGVLDSAEQADASDPVFHNHYGRLGTGNCPLQSFWSAPVGLTN